MIWGYTGIVSHHIMSEPKILLLVFKASLIITNVIVVMFSEIPLISK